jgi:hypothetical protein
MVCHIKAGQDQQHSARPILLQRQKARQQESCGHVVIHAKHISPQPDIGLGRGRCGGIHKTIILHFVTPKMTLPKIGDSCGLNVGIKTRLFKRRLGIFAMNMRLLPSRAI